MTTNPLLNPNRWVKGTYWKSTPGQPLQRCMYAWMKETLKDVEDDLAREELLWEVRRRLPGWAGTSVMTFWDHPGTTHEEAIAILKEAGWIKEESQNLTGVTQ